MTDLHSWQTILQRQADLGSGRRIRISTRRSGPSFRIRGFGSEPIRSRFRESPPRSCSLSGGSRSKALHLSVDMAQRDGLKAEFGIA
ncbi:unnamed protein product, partial [Linum tenue]